MTKANKNNLKNKLISCILAIQILLTTALPVVASAVTIEFPVKITQKEVESTDGIQVNIGEERVNLDTELTTKTIKDVDWKSLSEQELADVICATNDRELSNFLKELNESDTKQILSKQTALINPVIEAIATGETYIDKNGETWPIIEQSIKNERYYDYLLEQEYEEIIESNISLLSWGDGEGSESDTGSGQFTLKIKKDGTVETQITFKVKDVTQTEQTLMEGSTNNTAKYEIIPTKNGNNWATKSIKIKNHYENGSRDWSGIMVVGSYSKPEHYYTTWELDSKAVWDTMNNGNGRFAPVDIKFTDTLEHDHGSATDTITISCNSRLCGLSKYSAYSSINGTIEMKKFKEELKIDPNGGTHGGKTTEYSLATKKCGEETTVSNPTREGYRFTGWTVSHGTGANGSLSGTTYTHCINDAGWDATMDRPNDDGYWGVYTKTTRTTTLKANWVKNEFKLSVNPNGGTWDNKTTVSDFTITQGNTKTIANPTRTGYLFAGWSLSGTGSTLDGTTFTMGSADATLTASWTPITYTVVYNGNGHTGGSTASSTHTYDAAKNLNSNGFERKYTVTFDGNGATTLATKSLLSTYQFYRWYLNTAGTGTAYTNNQSVTNLSSEQGGTVNLYAKWTPASITLPTPQKNAYTFTGWYSGQTKVGDAGASYTPTKDITLKAGWNLNLKDITGSVSWNDENNKYNSRPQSVNVTLNHDNDTIAIKKEADQNPLVVSGDASYTFKNTQSQKESNNQNYTYTVTQNVVPGYETIVNGYNITNTLILPTYTSNITYTPVDTFENRYLKNGKVKVVAQAVANSNNRSGMHDGVVTFTVDKGITIDESKIKIQFYEASSKTTKTITNYTIKDNVITVSYGKNTNGVSTKDDKITIELEGMANKIGKYSSNIVVRGKLKDLRNVETNIDLGEVTKTTKDFTVEYQMPKARIQIQKRDSITEGNLTDAIFTLYEWNGTEYAQKEVIKDINKDGIYVSNYYEWNVTTQGKYKIVETKVSENHKDLNFSMEYVVNQLKAGNYTIKPDYSNTNYKITYGIRNPDDFDKVDGIVENEPIKVKAKIEKVDEETGKQIESDTIFTIYEWDNVTNEYKEYVSYTSNKTIKMERQKDGTYLTGEWLYYTAKNEGKYRIIETTAPNGYYGDYINQEESNEKNTYDINIVDLVKNGKYNGQTVENESILIISNQGITGVEKYLTNQRTKAQAKLQLLDNETKTNIPQANATLEGATYSIYALENIYHADGSTANYQEDALIYKKDELIQTLKTDENGYLVFENLECGKYYIKQDEAPEGYLDDETRYIYDLTYQGEHVETVIKIAKPELQVKKQPFQMLKLQSNSGTELNPLEGAGFSIYLISDLSIVKEGKVTKNENGTYTLNDLAAKRDSRLTEKANKDGSYEIEDLVDYFYKIEYTDGEDAQIPNDGTVYKPYKLQKENYVKNYENTEQGEYIAELKTNSEGYILSPELAYGEYIIIETSVPNGYEEARPFEVKVTYDSRDPQTLRFIVDGEFKARLKVNKIDATTGKLVLNNTAKYIIRNIDTNELVTYKTWDVQNKYVEYGTEQNPYELSDEGYLITPVELQTGRYELIELEAPNGYVLNGYEGYSQNFETINTPKSVTQINIASNTAQHTDTYLDTIVVTVTQENEPQVGALKLTTTGEKLVSANSNEKNNYEFTYEEEAVQGATYKIRAKEIIYTQDGQRTVLYAKDEVVKTIISNQNGIAIADNLPIGKYYIEQTKAGDGFTLNTEKKEFSIEYGNNSQIEINSQNWKDETQKTSVTKQENSYINQRQKIDIEITKRDEETNQIIQGATFALYNKSEILNKDNTKLLEANTKIETVTSDANGKIVFKSDLPLGNYYIKEEKAATGYVYNTQTIDVDGTYKKDQREIISIVQDYLNKKTNINVSKIDENSQALENATLQVIRRDTSEVIDEWTTKKDFHNIKGLETNVEYILKETKPAIGYSTAEDIVFLIQDNGKTKVNGTEQNENLIYMRDTEIKVEISLKDEDGNYVEGSKLQLINKDSDEVVAEWVTGTENYKITKLPIGTYIIRQVETPTYKGYATMEDREIQVIDTRDTQLIELIQPKIKVEISLKDKEGNYVEGSKIQLIDKEIGEVVEEWVTIEENHKIEKLPIGKYILKQVETPTDRGFATIEDKEIEVVDTRDTQVTELIQTEIKVEISLKDKEGNYVEGSKLQLINKETGEIVEEWVTGAENYKIEKLPIGKYILKQVETPTDRGFATIEDKEIEVVDTRDTQVTELIQTEIKVEISLKDNEGNYVEGSKLQLINKETGEVVEEWVTGAENHKIEKLPIGTYIIKQIETPTDRGFATIEDKEIEVVDTRDTQVTELIQTEIKVEISLKDKEGNYVEGSKLQLINKEAGEVVEEWVTGAENHKIEKLPIGTYIIKQIETPTDRGFATIEDKEIEVVDTRDTQVTELIQTETKVEVHVKDKEGNYVEGVVVQLIDKETGEVIDEWTTEDKPHLIEKVPTKEYTLHIVEVPEDKGYVLIPDQEVNVENTREVQKVEVLQDITKISVSLIDIETEEPVIGAILQIVDDEENVVLEWISSENEKIIEKLPVGKYKLVQKEVPLSEGYVKSEILEFEVLNKQEIQKVIMKQDFTKVEIELLDKTSKEKIEGMKIVLKDEEGKEIANWITEEESYKIERMPVRKIYYRNHRRTIWI